jgi:hypothetical protein
MPAVLLVIVFVFAGYALGVLVPRAAAARRRHVEEPLAEIADRVLAQLRALPETRERRTPER